MSKGIPKAGVNKGWFKNGHQPTNGFTEGHKRRVGIKHSAKTRIILSEKKKKLYAEKGNVIGFQPGNKLAEHPNVVATRFKEGENTGPNNLCWRGGISFEPYSLDWTQTLKRSIRERDRYCCQMCGLPQGDRAHDVHHIDYDKKNCDPKNLITLCHGCHTKTNFNRDYWIKFFRGGTK